MFGNPAGVHVHRKPGLRDLGWQECDVSNYQYEYSGAVDDGKAERTSSSEVPAWPTCHISLVIWAARISHVCASCLGHGSHPPGWLNRLGHPHGFVGRQPARDATGSCSPFSRLANLGFLRRRRRDDSSPPNRHPAGHLRDHREGYIQWLHRGINSHHQLEPDGKIGEIATRDFRNRRPGWTPAHGSAPKRVAIGKKRVVPPICLPDRACPAALELITIN